MPPSRLVLSNSSSGVHKASRTMPLQEWVRLEKLDADELAVHPRYPIQPTSQQAAAVVTTAPAPRTPFVPPQQVSPSSCLAHAWRCSHVGKACLCLLLAFGQSLGVHHGITSPLSCHDPCDPI